MIGSQGLQKRSVDGPALQQGREPVAVREQGEDIGFWKHLAERFQNFFAASHGEQPVVNECNFHDEERQIRKPG